MWDDSRREVKWFRDEQKDQMMHFALQRGGIQHIQPKIVIV